MLLPWLFGLLMSFCLGKIVVFLTQIFLGELDVSPRLTWLGLSSKRTLVSPKRALAEFENERTFAEAFQAEDLSLKRILESLGKG